MLLAGLALLALVVRGDDPRATVEVDRAKREVVITAGPFHVPSMPPGMKHEDMAMMNDHNTPLVRFEWPVEGWLRGFSVEVEDGNGQPVDRRIVHHLIGVNFDRRQLLYSNIERLFGVGQETEPVSVPNSIGVPMSRGVRLGMYMAWQNETGADLDNIKIRVRMLYSPPNLNPRPVSVLPLYMDVNLIGALNLFDVPQGRSEKSWEFTMPIGGRLLGYSGHLHDYGVSVRLEDVASGKVIGTVTGTRTPDGKLAKISRSLPGVGGDGLRLRAGRTYRVVGTYDNPTAATVFGVMAHITGIFAPDDMSKWPKIDLSDEVLQDDLAWLDELGAAVHHHAGHEP